MSPASTPSIARETNVNRAVIEDPSSLLPERSAFTHLGWEDPGQSQEGPGQLMRNNQSEGSRNLTRQIPSSSKSGTAESEDRREGKRKEKEGNGENKPGE